MDKKVEGPLSKAHHLTVDVAPDHLKRIANCPPLAGIAELVWNALDADAKHVQVVVSEGAMGGFDRIDVIDDGDGIDITRATQAFNRLGDSWKRLAKTTAAGRSMHGKLGRGRFRACSLGRRVEWETVNRAVDGTRHLFSVTIDSENLKKCEISAATAVGAQAKIGTHVTVTDLISPHARSFQDEMIRPHLVEEFGQYLLKYRAVKISVNGVKLDPRPLIAHEVRVDLPPVGIAEGRSAAAHIHLIEWRHPGERRIFLCDQDDMTVAEVPMRSHLLDGYVSVYVKSPELVAARVADVADEHIEQLESVRPILAAVRNHVKDYLRSRLAARSEESIDRWKNEEIYPYVGDPKDAVERVEREVFDIVAVNVDRFLPRFSSAAPAVKRMQFSLLRRALETQPDDLIPLIDQLVSLKQADREKLRELLQNTSLSNIIRGARVVHDRLQFLRGLEAMIHDPEQRTNFLETKHLHQLLAANTWIFGDAYALTASDESLTSVVRQHVVSAGMDVAVDEAITQVDGRAGRVDLMLTRALGPLNHAREHLIVELKRPTVLGSNAVLTQVKKYASALTKEPRFRDTKTRWTFIAVVYDFDDLIEDEALNRVDGPAGRILQTSIYSIWMRRWGQIIEDCRARLEFLRESFEFETQKNAGIQHLKAEYPQAMPAARKSQQIASTGRAKAQKNRSPRPGHGGRSGPRARARK